MSDEPIPSVAITSRPAYTHFKPSDLPQTWFYDEWEVRRNECPVSYSSEHGGFYFLTRYDDVYNTLSDPETFTSIQGAAIPPQPFKFIPEDLDPPQHRQYRRIVSPALAPQKMPEYEAWVRAEAVSLIDGLVGRSDIDAVRDFAGPFPRAVAMKLIGIPTDDLGQISEWTEILTYTPRESAESLQAGEQLFAYLGAFVDSHRDGPFGDNLVSDILRAEIDGERIGSMEAMSYVALLLFGGLHTTTHAIAGWLMYLASHPEQRARLIEDPAVMPFALDEALRWTSPSTHLGRVTTKNTVINGCPIPAGTRIMSGLGAANRDPSKFDKPNEMVLDRMPNAHAAFGFGPHRCVGSHLAKLQMKVAIEEWLKRFPHFEFNSPSDLRYEGGEVRGLITVPLVITSS